jgi:phage FluMu protein Com
MPIRFRCQYCDQLLGIARRKVGTEVRCPECQKMVLVPAQDAPDVDEPTRKRDFVFERGAVADPASNPPKEIGAPTISPAAMGSFDAELYRLPDPPQAAGVLLTPLHAILLTIGAVIVLALAFTVGLLVGRYVL